MIRLYEQTNDINKILGPLFGQMNINSNGEDITLYHKTTYNFDSLSSLLEDNGFSNVVRYDWRNTIHKDYDDHSQAYYPHMDKDNGILLSLNVEAIKND